MDGMCHKRYVLLTQRFFHRRSADRISLLPDAPIISKSQIKDRSESKDAYTSFHKDFAFTLMSKLLKQIIFRFFAHHP